jgi:CelD/BcsL family acetyltransferase involved in cellulose biosynthesis
VSIAESRQAEVVSLRPRPRSIAFDTISTGEALAGLAVQWDELVRTMPRPSPFLLHPWLREWVRHYGETVELRFHVAYCDGRLAAALPLVVGPRAGLRIARFPGGPEAVLGDLLLAPGVDPAVARELLGRAASDFDLADLVGMPPASRLAAAADPGSLRLIPRLEAPVLELAGGWDAVYRDRTSSKTRNLHRRRRRQLGELGNLEVGVARTPEELERALEEAFVVHARRWEGRPDRSELTTPIGLGFNRSVLAALAEHDVPRIVTLRLDGRAIAFHYYFALCGRMYVYHLGFDPAFSRFSPGLLNTLDTIEAASAEGLERVEFLGGAERYKIDLADRLDPLYEGFGLASGLRGRVAGRVLPLSVSLQLRLKRSPRVRRLYYEGLAPLRRGVTRLQRW